jgi:hypothetical protein
MKSRLLGLAAILAASCRTADRPAAAGDLQVTVTLESSSLRPREGDLAVVAFRFRNATDRTVVLKDLSFAAPPGPVMTWQFAQSGLLQYQADRDDWLYDRRHASDRPRPVFNSGLLVPGEEVTIRTRLRLLGLPKDLSLAWFELSRADLTQMVYFETRVDRETRYRRLVGDELNRATAAESRTDAAGHRVVIFPHAEQVVSTAKRRAVRVEGSLEPRSFGLAAAVRKAGFPSADEHSYASGLDGWVLRRGDEFRLVTSSAVTPLPRLRQMERVFHLVDAAGVGKVEVEFLRETKSVFSEKHRIVADPRKGRYFAFIPSGDILPFLGEVREAGLTVDAEATPEGGGRLTVTR